MDATLGTLKKCKCVLRPGLRRTRRPAPANPAARRSLAAPPARRRHLALSTNLISKISNLAGMDSCAPGAPQYVCAARATLLRVLTCRAAPAPQA